MTRLFWRLRNRFVRRSALLDALEEAYADCARLSRERDALARRLSGARMDHIMTINRSMASAPRSIP